MIGAFAKDFVCVWDGGRVESRAGRMDAREDLGTARCFFP